MKHRWLGLVLLLPAAALAHELTAQYGPFFGPALHVFTEIDHLTAFAVMGLLAAQQEPAESRYRTLLAFMAALTIGMLLPFMFAGVGAFDAVERELSAASTLTISILVAAAMALPLRIAAIAAAVLGGVHGLANGLAIAGSPAPVASVLGGFMAALLVAGSAAIIAFVLRRKLSHGRTVIRVLGSWIAALALMLLGLALRA